VTPDALDAPAELSPDLVGGNSRIEPDEQITSLVSPLVAPQSLDNDELDLNKGGMDYR
jgi:hypothetical protein